MGAPIPRRIDKDLNDYDKQIAELRRQIAEILQMLNGNSRGVDMNAIGRKFVSIEFFNQLFAAHGESQATEETEEAEAVEVTEGEEGESEEPSDIIEPNNIAEVKSIEAKAGFWTESFISALGKGGGGGGGGGGGVGALYECADVARDGDKVSGASTGKVLMYGSDGHWYAGSVQSSGGTVTSVGISVPTGFSVSPSTITSSGTFAIVFANGYSLPTTSKQTAWDKLIGYFDSNGNANSALKLTTTNKKAWGQTYWTSGGVPTDISGDMTGVGNITMNGSNRINPNGNHLYIGNADNASWVYLADMASQNGTNYWKILASGNAEFANVHSRGYVTALSDIRLKDIVGRVVLKAETIAGTSVIDFTWKDKHDDRNHIGGVAQEWQKILPEAITEDEDGHLSMDYGAISYASVVSLAKKVVWQDRKIRSLEDRLAKLEKLISEKI